MAYRGAAARALYEDLLTRFSGLPAVRSVSLTMDTPLGGEPSMSGTGISLPGRPADTDDAPRVFHNFVGPRFFETMGIRIAAGREFAPGDDERAPKRVIVSESLARRYFHGQDPLGRQILFGGVPATIVGIACAATRLSSLTVHTGRTPVLQPTPSWFGPRPRASSL
jgi:hypothetical protein